MSQYLGYRSADDSRVPSFRRWWPLATHQFSSLFRTRWGLALFFLCLVPGVGRLVMLLILFGVVNFVPTLRNRLQVRGTRDMASIDPSRVEFYLEPVVAVMPGMIFFLLLSSFVVARAIARDRTTNAIELYWTRGISPFAYLFAKWVGSTLVMSLLTVVVPLGLWLAGVFLSEDWSLLTNTASQLIQALAGMFLVTAIWTGIGTLISAACSTPNTATVLWCMLLVGSSALAFVLGRVLQADSLRSCLGVWDAGVALVRAMASIPQRGASVIGAVAVLAGLLLVLLLLASRRLRLASAIE